MPDMVIERAKDGRLEVDPDAAKVVKMIFQMAAEGMSFAEITRELNKQEIATCDEQKMSRGEQVQFRRFDTIMKNAGIQPQYLQSSGMRFILEPGYGVKHAAVCTPVIRRFLMTSLTGSGWKTTMIRLLTGNCLKKSEQTASEKIQRCCRNKNQLYAGKTQEKQPALMFVCTLWSLSGKEKRSIY